MHMVFSKHFIARAVFERSIKVVGWQSVAPKSLEHELPKKKCPDFFEIHRTSDTAMGSVAL